MTAIAGCVLSESIECKRDILSGAIYSIISATARNFGLTSENKSHLVFSPPGGPFPPVIALAIARRVYSPPFQDQIVINQKE
jgi:hypothetical protein